MECLDQLRKSLRGDDVMLVAGDSTTAEALLVDIAPVSEIDAELRATLAETVALRVRKDDVVQFRLCTASDQGQQQGQFQQHKPRHIVNLRAVSRLAFRSHGRVKSDKPPASQWCA